MQVVVQKWEESERGWGCRPDGYSLHPDEAAREQYIKAYWAKMPDEPPDEYSRPSGAPYSADVEIAPEDRAKFLAAGLRSYSNNFPGSGGTDGWKNAKD